MFQAQLCTPTRTRRYFQASLSEKQLSDLSNMMTLRGNTYEQRPLAAWGNLCGLLGRHVTKIGEVILSVIVMRSALRLRRAPLPCDVRR